jgi:hypothetical protein
MRQLSFTLSRTANLRPIAIVGERPTHPHRAYRRRLDDALADVFHRACAANDPQAASDLLAVLSKWQTRRIVRYGAERRISDKGLRKLKDELDRLTTRVVTH